MFLINFRPPERSTSHGSWPAKGNAIFCDWSNSRDDYFLLKNLFFCEKTVVQFSDKRGPFSNSFSIFWIAAVLKC